MKTLPTLYHKGKTGAIHSWKIWTEGADIVTEHGQVDGKKQIARKTAEPKNVGKKNATTGAEQAISEAESMHKYKLDRKYSLTPAAAKEPVLLPMLAKVFEDRKKDIVYPGYLQPKLDGVRCIARLDAKGNVELISRNGKPYNCPHIIKDLEKLGVLKDGTVLDGELYVHGTGFQTITSWVKKLRPETAKIEYHIYDMPESNGIDVFTWAERYIELGYLVDLIEKKKITSLKIVETIQVKNEIEVYKHQSAFMEQGYEGAIFRNSAGQYQYGYRSNDLLKVKTFNDAEFEIVGFTEGIGKDKGTVIWICKTRKGDVFNVRPAGTYEDRQHHFTKGNDYVGQQLTVKYFGLSDDGIPRFPVGLGFKEDR